MSACRDACFTLFPADEFSQNITRQPRHLILKSIPPQRTKPIDAAHAKDCSSTVGFVIRNIGSNLTRLSARRLEHWKLCILRENAKLVWMAGARGHDDCIQRTAQPIVTPINLITACPASESLDSNQTILCDAGKHPRQRCIFACLCSPVWNSRALVVLVSKETIQR